MTEKSKASDFKELLEKEKKRYALTIEPRNINTPSLHPSAIYFAGKIIKKDKPKKGVAPSYTKAYKRYKTGCFVINENNFDKSDPEQVAYFHNLISMLYEMRTIRVYVNNHRDRNTDTEASRKQALKYDIEGFIDVIVAEPLGGDSDTSDSE
ncbi:Oidioi.mRNA.OKI2018_I69.PAR.g11531.t1.cds [Oikopleura dioica]|uniref:Oidioi.mRNA.OKI2018_I69.PAR.g11531.t1.cds n=1 Tax=Oikopleura dioica TaxID=34765 RepID=A0ABN7RZF9_OIKDI|nr:Oidioi.mRNA.OKI2018_I69.PAR.g11531.t1.cds [Oikopleura dioica]